MRSSGPRHGRSALLVGLLLLAPTARAAIEPAHTFVNEIACSRAPGFGAADCRKAFAVARAEYVAKTRSYPSRFACYRAYGPCSPWPANGGVFAHFRPQFMGATVSGPATARSVLPVIAAGKARLALAARSLSEPLAAAPDAVVDPTPASIFAGGAATEALCRQIADGALKAHLPPTFLARLLWQESSFRPGVVSRAGALGIAQFMPETALERGLDDPFDPERAIATSASLLGDLVQRFGNLGLAAAAYNGGPARVEGWLQGRRVLAAETLAYVRAVTGRPVEDWAAHTGPSALADLPAPCFGPKPQAAVR